MNAVWYESYSGLLFIFAWYVSECLLPKAAAPATCTISEKWMGDNIRKSAFSSDRVINVVVNAAHLCKIDRNTTKVSSKKTWST